MTALAARLRARSRLTARGASAGGALALFTAGLSLFLSPVTMEFQFGPLAKAAGKPKFPCSYRAPSASAGGPSRSLHRWPGRTRDAQRLHPKPRTRTATSALPPANRAAGNRRERPARHIVPEHGFATEASQAGIMKSPASSNGVTGRCWRAPAGLETPGNATH